MHWWLYYTEKEREMIRVRQKRHLFALEPQMLNNLPANILFPEGLGSSARFTF